MEELNDLLRQISETITRLDSLKEQSSEVREAMAIQAKQEQLVKRLQERCKEATPQIVPMPYPVYPLGFPWVTPYPAPWHPWITTTDTVAKPRVATVYISDVTGTTARGIG